MTEDTRRFHEETLSRIEAEIAELQAVARYHRRQLGAGKEEALASGTPTPERSQQGSQRDPMADVSEGEFYGMSGPKAAKALLERMGRSRPLKTREIYSALRKGGVNISTEGVLYRSLFRESGTFHNVGRGVWGLRAWYPNAPLRNSRRANGDEEAAGDTANGAENAVDTPGSADSTTEGVTR